MRQEQFIKSSSTDSQEGAGAEYTLLPFLLARLAAENPIVLREYLWYNKVNKYAYVRKEGGWP